MTHPKVSTPTCFEIFNKTDHGKENAKKPHTDTVDHAEYIREET